MVRALEAVLVLFSKGGKKKGVMAVDGEIEAYANQKTPVAAKQRGGRKGCSTYSANIYVCVWIQVLPTP